MELASVDSGYTGGAAVQGLELLVVKLPEAKRGFVLLRRRWVVEHGIAASRFRHLARDEERLAAMLVSLHFLAFSCLMLQRFIRLTLSP